MSSLKRRVSRSLPEERTASSMKGGSTSTQVSGEEEEPP